MPGLLKDHDNRLRRVEIGVAVLMVMGGGQLLAAIGGPSVPHQVAIVLQFLGL